MGSGRCVQTPGHDIVRDNRSYQFTTFELLEEVYIPVAVWLLPLGEHCSFARSFSTSLRMEALLPERRQEIEELFDFERTDIAEQDRDRRVWKLFNDEAIPMLLKWDTLTVVRAAYKNGVFKQGFVHRTARALLEARAE